MKRPLVSVISLVFLAAAFFASPAGAQLSAKLGDRVANWTPPMQLTKETDATPPRAFIGVTPCRIVDTRIPPAGPYGPPSLPASTPRDFALLGGPCAGLPVGVSAYSLNITVTNTLGAGFISLYPQGGSAPAVSTLNYVAGQTIANAAIVPAGTGGGITAVAGVSGTDLLIDINGYFPTGSSSQLLNPGVHFEIAGNVDPPFATVNSRNNSNTAGAMAVLGIAGSNGVGVQGLSGRYGVLGVSTGVSGGPAGVFGQDSALYNPSTNGPSGVLGNSLNSFGVLGQSRYISVYGQLRTAADAISQFGLLGTTFGVAADTTVGPWAVFAGGTFGASGAKHFVEPHNTDPSRVVVYSSLEGREVGTYFRGTARVVGGRAIIQIPDDFRMVTDEEGLTVQLTSVRAFAQMYVESQDLNQIVIHSSKDVTFHYLVQGVRRAFKDFEPVGKSNVFMPLSATDRMPLWVTEEAKRRLIQNGTYNLDGTVNMSTAEAVGWTKVWQRREEENKAAIAAAAARRAKD